MSLIYLFTISTQFTYIFSNFPFISTHFPYFTTYIHIFFHPVPKYLNIHTYFPIFIIYIHTYSSISAIPTIIPSILFTSIIYFFVLPLIFTHISFLHTSHLRPILTFELPWVTWPGIGPYFTTFPFIFPVQD